MKFGRLMEYNMSHTAKPLKNGHLRVLKNLSVIERCQLLGGNLKKIVTFRTQCFVRYSWHVRYLGCPLLQSFTAFFQKSHRQNAVEKLVPETFLENENWAYF